MPKTLTVAAEGKADFKTVQAALDAVVPLALVRGQEAQKNSGFAVLESFKFVVVVPDA